jgi:hypothetical protein
MGPFNLISWRVLRQRKIEMMSTYAELWGGGGGGKQNHTVAYFKNLQLAANNKLSLGV